VAASLGPVTSFAKNAKAAPVPRCGKAGKRMRLAVSAKKVQLKKKAFIPSQASVQGKFQQAACLAAFAGNHFRNVPCGNRAGSHLVKGKALVCLDSSLANNLC
jgi:hypothetical protein